MLIAGPPATVRTRACCKGAAHLARRETSRHNRFRMSRIMVLGPESLSLCLGQAGEVRFRTDGALASSGRPVWACATGRRAAPCDPWQHNSPEKTGQKAYNPRTEMSVAKHITRLCKPPPEVILHFEAAGYAYNSVAGRLRERSLPQPALQRL